MFKEVKSKKEEVRERMYEILIYPYPYVKNDFYCLCCRKVTDSANFFCLNCWEEYKDEWRGVVKLRKMIGQLVV